MNDSSYYLPWEVIYRQQTTQIRIISRQIVVRDGDVEITGFYVFGCETQPIGDGGK